MRIKRNVVICLLILALFHLVNNYIWLKNDSLSFHKDVISHLSNQLDIFLNAKTILHSDAGIIGKISAIIVSVNKLTTLYCSSFFYSSGLIINLLFGYTPIIARFFNNTIYFIILVFSVFSLGKKLKNKEAGLVAAFIVSFFPGIFGSSRMYGLDFPLTAMVSLSLLLLILTANFKKTGYSLALGMIAGICFAIKAQGALFFIGPFIYILYRTFTEDNCVLKRKRVFNLAAFLLIISLIITLFYQRHILLLLSHFISHIRGEMIVPSVTEARPFSLGWVTFYAAVIKNNISWPYFCLFLIYLALFIKSRRIRDIFFPLLWLGVPYILLTVILLKDESYFFPGLPAVALIISLGITSYGKKIRKFLYYSLFGISMLNFLVLSYYGYRSGQVWQNFMPVKIAKFMAGSQWAHPPAEARYAIVASDFVDIIKKNQNPNRIIKIGIIEERYFKGDFAKCLAYFLKLRYPEIKTYLSCTGDWPFFLNAQFLSQASDFDYIIAFKECSTCGNPDFSGLKYFKLPKNRQKEYSSEEVDRLIKRLKEYTIIRRNFIGGSCMSVFLMSKQKLKPLDKPAAECRQVINLLDGKVIAIEPLFSRLVIGYRDIFSQYKKEIFYVVNGVTSYENVLSISDLKLNDSIIVDYYIDRQNRKVILNMSVDNISEIPHFLIEEPSGNLRNDRFK